MSEEYHELIEVLHPSDGHARISDVALVEDDDDGQFGLVEDTAAEEHVRHEGVRVLAADAVHDEDERLAQTSLPWDRPKPSWW